METEGWPSDAGRSGNWSRMGSSIVSRRFVGDDEVEKKSTYAICELELGLGGGRGYGGSEDVEAVKATAKSGENNGAGARVGTRRGRRKERSRGTEAAEKSSFQWGL
ncbi:hypothetical protein IEQ34_000180 [Dendrobium chrysotoxum]|uniref:Uncharacterized protein n=1 Tax=Dendrobium chrysotoxum TaxID=161865 RepID=A0AAV7HNW6_DENCH|nr:hypothetical protein IEQ34_000180 [Dendrobium chrysotoxum]